MHHWGWDKVPCSGREDLSSDCRGDTEEGQLGRLPGVGGTAPSYELNGVSLVEET